ncbi:MAG: ABC transporter substrate-binding protein [Gaiellales bacterium]
MRRLRLLAFLALAVTLAVLAAACGGGGEEEPAATEPVATEPADTGGGAETTPAETEPAEGEGPQPGGTYRVDVESSFDFTAAFDPSSEYTSLGWSFYTTLIRKLVTYPHTAGSAGNVIVPDLATDTGTVSEDGLTYTFTLKDGIKFGPPLSREITSADFVNAFARLATEPGSNGYPNYYTEIVGFEEYGAGEADTITGIEAPDDKTIVFTLEKPVGDFLYRLAMPAAGPQPSEVTDCFSAPGDYGRFVISSGPYMIEGSDALDASTCESMKPIAGFDPEASLILVRNPDYDPATDSPDVRPNYVDRFEFRINSNADDCFARVREALIDDTLCGETGKQIKEYTENEELKPLLKLNPDDSLFYIPMNLALPPFDDVHVRKAANLIMNKPALIRAWGGPTVGAVATHNLTPSLAPASLEGYDPYATPNSEGDLNLAMEEMKQSRYDTDQDGLCDAPECSGVVNIMGTSARDKGMVPVIEESMAKIGIQVKTRQLDDPYSVIFDPRKKIQMTGTTGWGKDYPDAVTFFAPLFLSTVISPTFSYNESLMGLTEEMAGKIGIDWPADGVPSIDADIDGCIAIADNDERLECWGTLTKKIMEEIAPWVPYIWRNNSVIIADSVTNWDFDQATGTQAWVRVAVDPEKQNS